MMMLKYAKKKILLQKKIQLMFVIIILEFVMGMMLFMKMVSNIMEKKSMNIEIISLIFLLKMHH